MHLLLYFLFRANNNYKKTVGDYKLRGERGTGGRHRDTN